MKLFGGLLTLLSAISIAAVAAYFSIIGLSVVFAATMIPVIVMASVLEAGKLVAAQWLKNNWKNKAVALWHKASLFVIIIGLMIITSIGIYGFLSKGHLEQSAPTGTYSLQIATKENKIETLKNQIDRLQISITQIDDSYNKLLENNKNTRIAINERNRQQANRKALEKEIDSKLLEIETVQEELVSLKLKTAQVDAKLGPIKYVAELLNFNDPEVAVRIIIVMLIIVFDPLAIILLLSANITLKEWASERRARKSNITSTTNNEIIIPEKPKRRYTKKEKVPAKVVTKDNQKKRYVSKAEKEYIKQIIESESVDEDVKRDLTEVVKSETIDLVIPEEKSFEEQGEIVETSNIEESNIEPLKEEAKILETSTIEVDNTQPDNKSKSRIVRDSGWLTDNNKEK